MAEFKTLKTVTLEFEELHQILRKALDIKIPETAGMRLEIRQPGAGVKKKHLWPDDAVELYWYDYEEEGEDDGD